MNDLMFTLNALLPIILVILAGYILKRIKLFDNDFFKKANKLCFRIAIPILLFKNVYDIKSFSDINWKFIGYIVIGILSLFIIGLIIVKLFVSNDKQKGVLLQSFFRSNYAIIGIPLAASLATGIVKTMTDMGAAEKIASSINGNASIASAFSIPLFNMLAVIALSIFDKGEKKLDENGNLIEAKGGIDVKKILLNICKNPLIHGVLSGLLVLGVREILRHFGISFTVKEDITFLYSGVEYIAKIATPLALIALGGQFEFKAVSKLKVQIIFGTLVRVLLVPAAGLLIARLFDFGTAEFPALIGIFATPVAVSSVPMAAEMKQDDELAGQLVVWTTLLTTISLFVIIMICRQVGIF